MVLVKCPKCGEKGSLQCIKEKYWLVFHNSGESGYKEHHYLGKGPHTVEVITSWDPHNEKVLATRSSTADDNTKPSEL